MPNVIQDGNGDVNIVAASNDPNHIGLVFAEGYVGATHPTTYSYTYDEYTGMYTTTFVVDNGSHVTSDVYTSAINWTAATLSVGEQNFAEPLNTGYVPPPKPPGGPMKL